MFTSIKEYVNKYKDTLFTLGFILILDHFVFSGAMRAKVQEVLEGMLNSIGQVGKAIERRIEDGTESKKS